MKVRDLVENLDLFKPIEITNAYEFYDSYHEYNEERFNNKDWYLKFLDYEITDITVEKPDYTGPGGTFICIKKPD